MVRTTTRGRCRSHTSQIVTLTILIPFRPQGPENVLSRVKSQSITYSTTEDEMIRYLGVRGIQIQNFTYNFLLPDSAQGIT